MSEVKEVFSSKCFGGYQKIFEHRSQELDCMMKFSVFLPSAVTKSKEKLPIVYFLSGLTCTVENFITKSGFQRYAERFNIIVVGPDTSPRDCNVPHENDEWDLGTGAGFYVDATESQWNKHYRMYSYVVQELRQVVDRNFPCVDGTRVGISGHSMGGHGALICALRNPDIYKAVTAFAPISNPNESSWGRKCFKTYLGDDKTAWNNYDATELIKVQQRPDVTILIDQGSEDQWMEYLKPVNFVNACKSYGQPLIFNEREGYGHDYYFVSTFISDHFEHFSKIL